MMLFEAAPEYRMTSVPSPGEARRRGQAAMASTFGAAYPEWIERAETTIREFAPGYRFLGEDVTMAVTAAGLHTQTTRALGPIIAKLKRQGVIRPTGTVRPARSSHGAPKTVWVRC